MYNRIAGLLVLWIALVLVLATALVAFSHEAPTGWSYPFSCCSGVDCREIDSPQSTVKIIETPEGYRFSTSGEVIPYNDPRIKESPDGVFHWCTQQGKDDTKTICLFVPPRGF